jgi:hypothetical protein
MGQPGFFDLDRRLEAISSKGDVLETIKAAVPWEDFRADTDACANPRGKYGDPCELRHAGRIREGIAA